MKTKKPKKMYTYKTLREEIIIVRVNELKSIRNFIYKFYPDLLMPKVYKTIEKRLWELNFFR